MDAELKKRIIITVAVWLTLAVLLALTLLGVIPDARAQGNAPQDVELEPVAWLPLLSSGEKLGLWLEVSQRVLEPGMLVTVDLWADRLLTDWDTVLYWDYSLRLRDAWRFPAPARHLEQYIFQATRADDEWLWVDATVTINGHRYVVHQILYVVPCVAEYTGDGIRNIHDIAEIRAHVCCEYGDGCYDELMDIDGDLAVTDLDVSIASLYWEVDCP